MRKERGLKKGHEANTIMANKEKGLTGKKTLIRKVRKKNALNEARGQLAFKFIKAGIVVAAAMDPNPGIVIAAPGIGLALGANISETALKRKLLKNPKAARMLAKEFANTKYAKFFERIAINAEARAKRLRNRKQMKALAYSMKVTKKKKRRRV